MKQKTKEQLCPLCCGPNHTALTQKRGYSIHLCRDCDHMFVFPRPQESDLNQIYQLSSGYFLAESVDLDKTSNDRAFQLHKLLGKQGIMPGRLLEIGCSTGKLLYHMRNLGWEVAGADINLGARFRHPPEYLNHLISFGFCLTGFKR